MGIVLDGLTIDGTTGEIIGLPDNGRDSARYAWDHEGYAREIAAGEVALNGARYALDPDKLLVKFGVSATSPASVDITLTYVDVNTSAWSGGSQIHRGIATGEFFVDGLVNGDFLSLFVGKISSLTYFYCDNNNLTGTIPSLVTPLLRRFYCHKNSLSGSIPSLVANTALDRMYCYTNNFTGAIPSLAANTALSQFNCSDNDLTGYAGGWPNKAFNFNASANALTETAVNLILTEADTYGIASGTTIDLSGGTNAAPTGAGVTAKANLIANGATVTTN